jgi:hypothetical protein
VKSKSTRQYSRASRKQQRRRRSRKQDQSEFHIAKEQMDKFDPRSWELSMAIKRQMNIFAPRSYQPDKKILEKLSNRKDIGLFIGDGKYTVTVSPTESPDEKGSFGFIDVFARVWSNSTFIPGTLVLRFDNNRLRGVARETLRLFRWDENLQSFQNVSRSGVSNYGNHFVWGRITLPGTYAIIGLQSHPLVVRTAKIFALLSDLMGGLKPHVRKRLHERICKLLLHSPELNKAIEEPEVLNALILESAEQGLPNPMNGWSRSHGGFESNDFPDPICPDPSDDPGQPPLKPERPLKFKLPEEKLISIISKIHLADKWENVGPIDLSGAISQVVVDPVNSRTIYAASSDGGLWRLNDISKYPSVTWVPLTDQNDSLITRSVAIAPSNNKVIYIADGLGHILRSPNRGSTWSLTSKTILGWWREGIYKIIINPINENYIFVASNYGLWRSPDGGYTWDSEIIGRRKFLDIKERSKVSILRTIVGGTDLPLVKGDVTDVVMDPLNPSILYIGMRNSGVWKSSNSGDDWSLILPWSKAGTPPSKPGEAPTNMIKIALGRMGDDSNRLVAVKFHKQLFINRFGGDRGDWELRGEAGQWGDGDQSNYDNVIAIDPFNNDNMLTGLQDLYQTYKGIDGASAWRKVGGYDTNVHPDQLSIMFDPKIKNRVYLSNDGGVYVSNDGGFTWIDLNNNLITAQFHSVGVSYAYALVGMYHEGIVGSENINLKKWSVLEGGSYEFTNVFADPARPDTFYLYWTDVKRKHFPSSIKEAPQQIGSFPPSWRVPAIAVDPRPTFSTLLVGTTNPAGIMRTKNVHEKSPAWNSERGIKNYLLNPFERDPIEGIVSISFVPSKPGMAYAASSTGWIYRKDDVNSEAKWEQVGRWEVAGVRQIAVNALHEDHLYLITQNEFDLSQNRIARSIDGGKSWVEVGKGTLPESQFNSILAHRSDGQTIFLGAWIGVFISTDEGDTWSAFDYGLPNAQVYEIFWSDEYIYAATHGRGLWRKWFGIF